MTFALGPDDLEDFEDRVLYHVVNILGNDPVTGLRGITEDDIAERMTKELSLDPSVPRSAGFYHSDARVAILEAVKDLEHRGYLKALKVSGPWTITLTSNGRRRVAEWRKQWEKARDRQEREIEQRILRDLDAQRRSDTTGYMNSSQLDVAHLCSDLGIDQDRYVAAAQRLIDEGKVAEADSRQNAIADGYIHITAKAAQALQESSGVRSDETARAWNEVARLQRELEVAKRDLPSLIADDELRRRTEDLLTASGHYDRVVREACVILENRVRAAINAAPTVVGVPLMELAFSPKQGKLVLSAVEQEQLGLMQMFRGVMAFFRNSSGHHVSDQYTREQALRFVVYIDMLLDLTAQAVQRSSQPHQESADEGQSSID